MLISQFLTNPNINKAKISKTTISVKPLKAKDFLEVQQIPRTNTINTR